MKNAILINKIEKSILKKDLNYLDELVFQVDEMLLEEGRFPDQLFEGIIKIIAKKEFLKLTQSWYLLKLFEENIDILSEGQKEKLLETLQLVFNAFYDTTSCFLITEIIVELFLDERSLNTLRKLKLIKEKSYRAIVPHGFHWFVKKCKDKNLTNQAYNELITMKNDSDPDVRKQSEVELRMLAR